MEDSIKLIVDCFGKDILPHMALLFTNTSQPKPSFIEKVKRIKGIIADQTEYEMAKDPNFYKVDNHIEHEACWAFVDKEKQDDLKQSAVADYSSLKAWASTLPDFDTSSVESHKTAKSLLEEKIAAEEGSRKVEETKRAAEEKRRKEAEVATATENRRRKEAEEGMAALQLAAERNSLLRTTTCIVDVHCTFSLNALEHSYQRTHRLQHDRNFSSHYNNFQSSASGSFLGDFPVSARVVYPGTGADTGLDDVDRCGTVQKLQYIFPYSSTV
eukprot:1157877-Rhodomonas_salina.1